MRSINCNQNYKNLYRSFHRLEKTAPCAFRLWRELLTVNSKEYTGFPAHSCSVEGHKIATHFKDFITPFLKGRILDVGCGPQPLPLYLEGYSLNKIWGIDPISEPRDHPFCFKKGVAEFLPLRRDFFDVVIAATSLDHVFLLDKAYSEIYRVVKKNGFFLAWLAFVKGAEYYNPHGEKIKPADEYHLFHFDKPWFEESFKKYFTIEKVVITNFEIDHYFYCLKPRSYWEFIKNNVRNRWNSKF
ncbi:MAG: methyltransferase domain-containing protein [Candidatus Omnitrophota bacterium]